MRIRRRPRLGHRTDTRFPVGFDRVLGPTAPQVTCDECFAQIDRYVELEVAGVDAARVLPRMRSHLDGCPACLEEHDDLLAFLRAE